MKLRLRIDILLRYLIPISLFYLAIPYLIFVVGWLKWYLALFYFLLIILSLFVCIRQTECTYKNGLEELSHIYFDGKILLIMVIMGTLLLGISGIGGFGYQDTDWLKHNAILKDLIEKPWPVIYQLDGVKLPLVYYIAFYLPAALFGKFGGWFFANQILFVWSLIGLNLAILWFIVLIRRASPGVLLLFIMFSGLDVIGEWLITPRVAALRPEYLSYLNWGHIEPWAIGWQYSSNTTLLFWVPHQALAGWIATGILLYCILYSRIKAYIILIVGLTILWSPFVMIGLLPYLFIECLLGSGPLTKRLSQYISLPNLCGLGLIALIGFYYSSKLVMAAPFSVVNIPHGFSLSFVPDNESKAIGAILIVIFCLLEFGLYSIIIIGSQKDWNTESKVVFYTTIACLLLLPLYRIGEANDFVMRASIPALFVLTIFLGRILNSQSLPRFKRIILVIFILIGSVTVLIELHRHILGIYNAGTLENIPQISQVKGIDEWGFTTNKEETILVQYVGNPQAPFFEFMARKP
jgi:hypothetical protein